MPLINLLCADPGLYSEQREVTRPFILVTSVEVGMVAKPYILLFLIFCLQYGKANAASKPNILMIVIDDLGWNDTSYQGSDIPTPTIDKFAC